MRATHDYYLDLYNTAQRGKVSAQSISPIHILSRDKRSRYRIAEARVAPAIKTSAIAMIQTAFTCNRFLTTWLDNSFRSAGGVVRVTTVLTG